MAGLGLPFLKLFSSTDLDGYLKLVTNVTRYRYKQLPVQQISIHLARSCRPTERGIEEPLDQEHLGYFIVRVLDTPYRMPNKMPLIYKAGFVFWER